MFSSYSPENLPQRSFSIRVFFSTQSIFYSVLQEFSQTVWRVCTHSILSSSDAARKMYLIPFLVRNRNVYWAVCFLLPFSHSAPESSSSFLRVFTSLSCNLMCPTGVDAFFCRKPCLTILPLIAPHWSRGTSSSESLESSDHSNSKPSLALYLRADWKIQGDKTS